MAKKIQNPSKPPLPKGRDLKVLEAACGALEREESETPDSLMSFKIYPDKVALVISTGQKFEVSYDAIEDWLQRQARRLSGAKDSSEAGAASEE